MVLCSYDGVLYHGQSAICEKLIADKDLIKSFGSLLQCKCPIIFIYLNIIINVSNLKVLLTVAKRESGTFDHICQDFTHCPMSRTKSRSMYVNYRLQKSLVNA